MRSTRWIGFGMTGLLFGVGTLLGGCGATDTPPPTTATNALVTPDSDDVAADLTEHHRHHHHGGITMFIAMSLDSLGIPPDQKPAIDKIQADLYAKLETSRVAEQGLATVLADGIATGGVDAAKVDASVAQVAAAAGALHETTADALNQLHDKLAPEQRVTLMDKVRAHWSVWKNANADQDQPGQDLNHDGKVSLSEQSHLETLATEIGLSPDQVAKIRAGFSDKMKAASVKFDPSSVDAHVQELVAAFEAPTFDAKKLEHRAAAHSQMGGYGARRMAHFYLAVDPVLTTPQRGALSAMIREQAQLGQGASSVAPVPPPPGMSGTH